MNNCQAEIKTHELLCGDQFYRKHWRAECACGFLGTMQYWKSYAISDMDQHNDRTQPKEDR